MWNRILFVWSGWSLSKQVWQSCPYDLSELCPAMASIKCSWGSEKFYPLSHQTGVRRLDCLCIHCFCLILWPCDLVVYQAVGSSIYQTYVVVLTCLLSRCSASNDYLFDHTESHHSHSVILYFNLTKAMFIPRPLRHQKYVQVLCNATLCFPSPEDRELVDLDLPMVS